MILIRLLRLRRLSKPFLGFFLATNSIAGLCLASAPTSASLDPRAALHNCTTCAPNIIADTYPNNVTATINGTSFILVVPIDYARSLLPTRLESLILPNFMRPLLDSFHPLSHHPRQRILARHPLPTPNSPGPAQPSTHVPVH